MNPSPDKVYARVGAKVLIRNKDGKILVLRRSGRMSRPGGWDLPGGASDFGEALEDTVVRETREETGIVIENPKLVLIHSYTDGDDYIVLAGFNANISNGEVVLSAEHDKYEWLSSEEVQQRSWPSFHQKLVEKLL